MARSLNLKLWICLGGLICLSNNLLAKAFMGEYKGTFYPDRKFTMNATADVVAEGDGKYRIVIDAKSDDPAQEGAFIEIYGKKTDSEVTISGRAGGYEWKGEIKDGKLNVRGHYGVHFELKKIESKSPRAGAKPPPNAVILLPYKAGAKPDMSGWTNTKWTALDNGSMQIVPGKGPNRTRQQFSDIKQLHVEFKLPLEPKGRGQGRANSGVYLLDAYEVQVLDSFGIVHTSGDCGGIYNVARAKVNACLPPETWQTYDISFRAARLDEKGKVKELPRITVVHNGVKIHDNVEIPKNRHRTKGPIQLQDHKHNIEFRNIWLVEGQ
jgi:hypothetical protein